MSNYPSDTVPPFTTIPKKIEDALSKETGDYSEILKKYGLEYKVNGYYLQVGDISKVQGWILHISVIKSQMIDLLESLIPALIKENTPFKIATNRVIAGGLLDGSLNYTQLAKLVCIYPENDSRALYLARVLIELTQ